MVARWHGTHENREQESTRNGQNWVRWRSGASRPGSGAKVWNGVETCANGQEPMETCQNIDLEARKGKNWVRWRSGPSRRRSGGKVWTDVEACKDKRELEEEREERYKEKRETGVRGRVAREKVQKCGIVCRNLEKSTGTS